MQEREQQNMSSTNLLQPMFGLTLVLLLLAGCDGAQTEPTATPAVPSTMPTPMPPTATPVVPTATATPVPPTATPTAVPTPTRVPLTAATVIAAGGDEEWDLVVMGDCQVFRLMPRYAEHLARDLGVEIEVHDWARGELGSSRLLEDLRTNPELRRDIGEAEVVIFDMMPTALQNPANRYSFGSPGACGGTDNQDCLREALQEYKADTDAIIAEIVSLRSPSEALLRTMDIHEFMAQDWEAAGSFDVVNSYKQAANEHIIQVAGEHHIPVARVYAAFRGPDGDEDPVDKGYVYDGLHPTEEGADLLAELFRELGYEYAPQEP
jgi:hypothetical protein